MGKSGAGNRYDLLADTLSLNFGGERLTVCTVAIYSRLFKELEDRSLARAETIILILSKCSRSHAAVVRA